MIYFYLLGNVTMVGVEVNSLVYRVPVDQPLGKESLVTPTHVPELAPPARPPAEVRHDRRARMNGVLTHAVVRLTGGLHRKPRISWPDSSSGWSVLIFIAGLAFESARP